MTVTIESAAQDNNEQGPEFAEAATEQNVAGGEWNFTDLVVTWNRRLKVKGEMALVHAVLDTGGRGGSE